MSEKKCRKDRTYCCVPQCNSKGSRNPDLSFHKFPNEKYKLVKTCATTQKKYFVNKRDEWIRLIKTDKKISSRMTVCSKHFKEDDFNFPRNKCVIPRLKISAVPSLHLPIISTYNHNKHVEKKKADLKRQARYEKINSKKQNALQSMHVIVNDAMEEPPAEHVDSVVEDILSLSEQVPDTQDNSVHEQTVEHQTQPNRDTQDQGVQVCSGDLQLPYIIKTAELSTQQIKSLTGLPSKEMFVYLTEKIKEEKTITNRHNLPLKERLMLTLMKLKLNLSFASLAVFFGCTQRTASNIFCSLIPILSSILSSLIEWPSKESIVANLPKCFSDFQNVRVVLDCTEILVQKPKCLTERIMTYSQYYGEHTIKFLIGVSPGGMMTFLSKGYGGRASDRLIFEESNIIHMLEPNIDAVMTDKGFLIEEICQNNFIKLIRPPFLQKKSQFSAAEALSCRKIASARVHVERVIQRIKMFNILKSTVPYNLTYLIDHIVIIASGLANCSSPILSDDKYEINILNL